MPEMQSKKLAGAKPGSATQRYLYIGEIRDGAVILKDGTLRAVMATSSLNFALKSEDEQNAIVSGYVGFLNSISFPLQIVIQSRKLRVDDYLDRLKETLGEQTNELLRIQTAEYIGFVSELVELGEIMNKSFYVVVPFSPISDKARGFFSRAGDLFKVAARVKLKEAKFQEYKKKLDQRVGLVISGLSSIGVKTAPLDTQSLIELFYNTYNPILSERQNLEPLEKMRVEESQ